MGLIYTTLSLRNPSEKSLGAIEVIALVDTGGLHMCIPQHVALQLNLEALEEREVTLADGSKSLVPYVGPLEIRFATGAVLRGPW